MNKINYLNFVFAFLIILSCSCIKNVKNEQANETNEKKIFIDSFPDSIKNNQIDSLPPAKSTIQKTEEIEISEIPVDYIEYRKSGYLLTGNEVNLLNSNYKKQKTIIVPALEEIKILSKTANKYFTPGNEDVCEKVNYLKAMYQDKPYILSGDAVYENMNGSTFNINFNGEEINIFTIGNYNQGPSNSDGPSGCNTYQFIVIKKAGNFFLIHVNEKVNSNIPTEYAYLQNNDGGGEELKGVVQNGNNFLINISTYTQVSEGSYKIKVAFVNNVPEGIVIDFVEPK